jgi:AcrR family transcriptional regulator
MLSQYPLLPDEGAAEECDPRALRMIEAAYCLLDEGGLEGLTIRAVLARTGLARRAFYENFTGKDDLVLAVFDQTVRTAANYYKNRANVIADPLERLHLVISSVALSASELALAGDPLDFATRNRRSAALAREHLRLAESRPRDLQRVLAPLIDQIAEILREAMANGQARQADATTQATLIYNLLSTTIHSELLGEEDGRPDHRMRKQLSDAIWDFVLRAISP